MKEKKNKKRECLKGKGKEKKNFVVVLDQTSFFFAVVVVVVEQNPVPILTQLNFSHFFPLFPLQYKKKTKNNKDNHYHRQQVSTSFTSHYQIDSIINSFSL